MSFTQWIIIDDTPLTNYPLDLTYSVIKPEFNNREICYIVNIIANEPLKVKSVVEIYKALEDVLYELKKVEKIESGTCIYTIYDLKEGIKFVPDIKMLSVGLNYVKKIEKYNDVKLNGAVAIVDGNNNSYSRLAYAANFFARNLHIRIATSYEEAYNFIKKYSKTEEIRKLSFV